MKVVEFKPKDEEREKVLEGIKEIVDQVRKGLDEDRVEGLVLAVEIDGDIQVMCSTPSKIDSIAMATILQHHII